MENLVSLQKIPLERFIDVLIELYDRGADFVDIVGSPDKEQDMMSIIVRLEYVDPERNDFDNEEEIIDDDDVDDNIDNKKNCPVIRNVKLSEKDLNNLI